MKRRVLLSTAFLVAAALSARSLTLLALTDAEIVKASDRIVVGTVLTSTAQWADPDGDGIQSIYTVATFRVDQVVKGTDQPGAYVTLQVFGGTIGNRTMGSAGVPLWKKDERLLLCLYPDPDKARLSPIVGAIQGRWQVTTNANGKDIASRDLGEAQFMARQADGSLTAAAKPAATEEPLSDVITRLQSEMAK
ncbi:MAG: hypothetical protein K8T20_00550 [Planctomycetes bacterium]|nr:hypothetical protein [Planctomycetota bacterium]